MRSVDLRASEEFLDDGAPILASSLAKRSSIAVSLYESPIDRELMSVVTVSPKFQVVIPRAIREALRLEPGQKVQAFQYQNRVEFIPVQPMRKMRGFLKGIDTAVARDKDRV